MRLYRSLRFSAKESKLLLSHHSQGDPVAQLTLQQLHASMGARLSYPAVDLGGKVALVTGGNTGIGYETSKALAVMGAHTIIACRSEERATTVSMATAMGVGLLNSTIKCSIGS